MPRPQHDPNGEPIGQTDLITARTLVWWLTRHGAIPARVIGTGEYTSITGPRDGLILELTAARRVYSDDHVRGDRVAVPALDVVPRTHADRAAKRDGAYLYRSPWVSYVWYFVHRHGTQRVIDYRGDMIKAVQ